MRKSVRTVDDVFARMRDGILAAEIDKTCEAVKYFSSNAAIAKIKNENIKVEDANGEVNEESVWDNGEIGERELRKVLG